MMDELKKHIPIISGSLILIGVTKLFFYYGWFDIGIISYLSFGEIITSFLDDVVLVILLFVLMIFHLSVGGVITKVLPNKGEVVKILEEDKYKSVSKYLGVLFMFLAIVLVWFFPKFFLNEYILFFFGYFVMAIFLDKIVKNDKDGSFVMFFSCVLYVLVSTYTDIRKIYVSEDVYHIKCIDDQLNTSKDIKLIGKTENYLFLRNTSKNINYIIPNEEVKKITVFSK